MSAQGAARSAVGKAQRAGQSDGLENLARIGMIAFGVVHLLVAWIALQLAWGGGGGGKSADQSGAMQTLADSPVGKPLLWVVALGLVALAVWQAAEIFRWRSGWSASGKTRTKALRKSGNALVKAAVYIALAVLAIKFAIGSGQSSSQQQQQNTAGVLGWPGGQFLVAAAGLVLIGSGIWHIRKGFNKHFLKQIDTSARVKYSYIGFVILPMLMLIMWDPPTMLFAMFVSYATYGPVQWLVRKLRRPRPAGTA